MNKYNSIHQLLSEGKVQLKHTFLVAVIFLCQLSFLYAQMERANKFYDQKEYSKALKLYTKEYEKTQLPIALIRLAHCYRLTQNYPQAEIYYEKALQYDTIDPKIPVYYAEVLKFNNKISKAKEVFVVYSNEKARDYIMQFDELKAWAEEEPKFQVSNFQEINSSLSEFSPVLFEDGIVFVSEKQDKPSIDDEFRSLNEPYLSVFSVAVNDSSAAKPEVFSHAINNEYHNGPVTFSPDQSEVVFTRVNSLKKGKKFQNKPQLYISKRKGKSWQKAEPFQYNDINYSFAHPALNETGNLLYFVSDKPNGKGGKDIYVCERTAEGWSEPKNLGEPINTKKDELFPVVGKDGTLYFSSNGHNGFGALDIFYSKYQNEKFNEPVNLKTPINSAYDDFGIVFLDSINGLFSSNRREGKGRDDIYKFNRLPPTQKDLANSSLKGVFLYSKLKPAANAKLKLLDENNVEIASTVANRIGEFEFKNLKANKQYVVVIDESDPNLSDQSTLYVINNKGEKVEQLLKKAKGYYIFKALPREEYAQLEPIVEEDFSLNAINLFGQLYEKLPGDISKPLEIQIVNDEGEILYTTFTDEKGNFVFENLPPDQHYRIQTKNGLKDTKMLVLNEKEGSIIAIKKDKNGGYTYELLSRDSLALAQVKNVDFVTTIQTNLKATFMYTPTLAASGVRLTLIDDKNTKIRTIFTDELGNFEINNIRLYKNYTLVADAEDSLLTKESNIYVVNENGKAVEKMRKETNEYFHFQPLSKEEYALSPILAETDFQTSLFGKAFKTLPGDVPAGMKVFLVDDKGNIIYTTTTDRFGNFEFKNLPKEHKYLVKLEEENPELNITTLDPLGEKLVATKNDKGYFIYKRLHADSLPEAFFLQNNDSSVMVTSLFGKAFKKLPGDIAPGMKVHIVDDKGNILYTTVVDQFGNFEFKNLPKDQQFLVKLEEEDEDINMMILNEQSQEMEAVKKDEKGRFQYAKLASDSVAALASLSEKDSKIPDNAFNFFGKAFKKLPGDIAPGMKVHIVDDEGNILYTTTMDANGNFEFKNLPPDKNYIVKLETEDGEIKIIETDELGNNTGELTANSKGEFEYKKLTSDQFVLKLLTNDNTQLQVKRSDRFIFTYLYYEYDNHVITPMAKKELDKLIEVLNLNPSLKVSLEAHTDSKGPDNYNLALSQRRAKSAKDYLLQKGIKNTRISAKGYGEVAPVAPNELPNGEDNPEGRAKNRRTEVRLSNQ